MTRRSTIVVKVLEVVYRVRPLCNVQLQLSTSIRSYSVCGLYYNKQNGHPQDSIFGLLSNSGTFSTDVFYMEDYFDSKTTHKQRQFTMSVK